MALGAVPTWELFADAHEDAPAGGSFHFGRSHDSGATTELEVEMTFSDALVHGFRDECETSDVFRALKVLYDRLYNLKDDDAMRSWRVR